MTDCPNGEMRDRLPDLLNDRLDAAQRRVVEAHVRECRDCREELELLRLVRAAAPTPTVDVARIVQALPRPRARRAWVRPAWMAAAAALVLAVGVTAVLEHRASELPADSVRVAAASTGDSGAGTSTGVELSVGYGYSDLSDAQLETLLTDIQQMSAIPMSEPDMKRPTVSVGNGGV